MSQRYFLRFSYDGTSYHGWQTQPHAVTVQETMTGMLRKLFGPTVDLVAAGRTDAGVHARTMYAHFDAPDVIEDPSAMALKLNGMMPRDIAVQQLIPVRNGAHARFDATSRTYEYWIGYEKDPFHRDYFLKMHRPLDFDAMNRAARALFDYTDFTCFSKLHTDVKTNDCTIHQAFWEPRGAYWVFTIQANRFLRNMVRAVVGTLFEVGWGKLDEAGFRRIIESKNRCEAGHSVLAKGLFLTGVTYPDVLFDLAAGDYARPWVEPDNNRF